MRVEPMRCAPAVRMFVIDAGVCRGRTSTMPHAFAYNERFDWDRTGHRGQGRGQSDGDTDERGHDARAHGRERSGAAYRGRAPPRVPRRKALNPGRRRDCGNGGIHRSCHRTTRQELNAGRIGGAVYIAPLTLRSRSAKMLLSGETEFRVNRGDDYRLPFD